MGICSSKLYTKKIYPTLKRVDTQIIYYSVYKQAIRDYIDLIHTLNLLNELNLKIFGYYLFVITFIYNKAFMKYTLIFNDTILFKWIIDTEKGRKILLELNYTEK